MNEMKKKKPFSLYRLFIYVVLIALAVSIIVPVAWVFMASIKQNNEFYGNPWALPAGFYFQNFVDAWTKARMGEYMLNTVILSNVLSFWNEYIIAMTLLSDPNGGKTLPVGLMNLMKAQNAAAQYGQMYAGLVMVMLPTLILYICVQKKLTQGMTLGGLKG